MRLDMVYYGYMKTTRHNRPLRLLAHLYAMQKASREMSGGMLHYAATHPDVTVQFYGIGTPRSRMTEFRAWKPDGVIVGASDRAMVRQIKALGCKAAVFVNVECQHDEGLVSGSVFCDNSAVAAAAARLFASKRLKRLAYVGTRRAEAWSVERGAEFCRAVSATGASVVTFEPPASCAANHRRELSALSAWIAALPKPCGIFTANDARAKDVLDACREAAVAIPEQVMVLGVDDEEFICRQTVPTLSSVVPDFAKGGYVAAETLVALLRDGRGRAPRRMFGVQGVIERSSTSDPNGAGRMVSRADEFIRAYATTGISVSDIAKASGASLRLLQKNYQEITGSTLIKSLQTARLKRVCELLAETSTSIGRIGELSGFGNERYLKKLFRSRFGCTMREWRRRAAGADVDGKE